VVNKDFQNTSDILCGRLLAAEQPCYPNINPTLDLWPSELKTGTSVDPALGNAHASFSFATFFTVRAVATNCIVFVRAFFLCDNDNLWTAALKLMKFCVNVYLDNL